MVSSKPPIRYGGGNISIWDATNLVFRMQIIDILVRLTGTWNSLQLGHDIGEARAISRFEIVCLAKALEINKATWWPARSEWGHLPGGGDSH